MKSWQIVRLVAGFFILLSLALGVQGSPVFVSTWWLAFTAFVGANLLQSALTKWCMMETILRKLQQHRKSLGDQSAHLHGEEQKPPPAQTIEKPKKKPTQHLT